MRFDRMRSMLLPMNEGGNASVRDVGGRRSGMPDRIPAKDAAGLAMKVMGAVSAAMSRSAGILPWGDLENPERFLAGSLGLLLSGRVADGERESYGDIDVMVDAGQRESFRRMLLDNAGKDLSDGVVLVGFVQRDNRPGGREGQFNAVLETEGRKVQLDLSFVEFGDDGLPSDFDVFVRSHSPDDMAAGIRGAFHKLLLRCLAGEVEVEREGMVATPATAAAWVSGDRGRFKVSSRKGSETREVPTYSFSSAYGLRRKHEPLMTKGGKELSVDGRRVFREVPAGEGGNRSVPSVFSGIFGRDPSEDDLRRFGSFVGLLSLMSEMDDGTVERTFSRFLATLYGDGKSADPRGLHRNDPEADRKDKESACRAFVEAFPRLSGKLRSDAFGRRVRDYYRHYGERNR